MKVVVKSRTLALLPSVQYGNITLESAIELEEDVAPAELSLKSRELQRKANTMVVDSLKEQKEAIEQFEKGFFRVNL